MNKVRKLTPATLKRIIAEEKFKIKEQTKRRKSSKKISNKKLVESYIKILKLFKSKQVEKAGDIKRLEEARKLIKQKPIERL